MILQILKHAVILKSKIEIITFRKHRKVYPWLQPIQSDQIWAFDADKPEHQILQRSA
jgi:hypothetical protein